MAEQSYTSGGTQSRQGRGGPSVQIELDQFHAERFQRWLEREARMDIGGLDHATLDAIQHVQQQLRQSVRA